MEELVLVEGRFVRLRHAEHGRYLYADENGVDLYLSQHRASLNTAWLVHRVPAPDHRTVFRLSGAAYGLYLTNSPQLVADGPDRYLLCQRTLRIFHGEQDRDEAVWEAITMGNGAVSMNHAMYANVLDFEIRVQNAGILIMNMHWFIEPIPLTQEPPQLQYSRPAPAHERCIMYVLAENDGWIDVRRWRRMDFYMRGVYHLRGLLAIALGVDILEITICVWHGFGGGLTPLVVDLPTNQNYMAIVVLPIRSPVARALRYPNVDA